MESLYAAQETADLEILAAPVYIDSLPAPTNNMLDRITARRGRKSTTQRLAAISNCGFPEALHTRTLLAICASFAQEAGFQSAGGLSLGGDGLHGKSLNELGKQVNPIRQALAQVAQALAAGKAIPKMAQDLLTCQQAPIWVYRMFGNFGWGAWVKQYGAQKHLRDTPYLVR